MAVEVQDKAAPMASAPMKYCPDGSVDWGNMWDSFCALALDGGPPHRGAMLHAPTGADPTSPAYRAAAAEIIRGIAAVSGLAACVAEPGWIAVECCSTTMARWLSEAINGENVQARYVGTLLLVPVGESFTLKGEIKNVITAVAKTTHYWHEHLPLEAKQALAVQDRIERATRRIAGWLGRV